MSITLCEKLKRGCKRALSGLLAAATFASLLPEAVIPKSHAAAADNIASPLQLSVGEQYFIKAVKDAEGTFANVGANANTLRQVWSMDVFQKDGSGTALMAGYCANYDKHGPGKRGKVYTVKKKVDDMRLYGVAVMSDERVTTAEMINWRNDRLGRTNNPLLTAASFTERMHEGRKAFLPVFCIASPTWLLRASYVVQLRIAASQKKCLTAHDTSLYFVHLPLSPFKQRYPLDVPVFTVCCPQGFKMSIE